MTIDAALRPMTAIPAGVHGWLALDKPAGLTSAACVAILRRLAGGAKTGHGGTLDPLATGVLPIAFGEATKTVAYVAGGGAKTYEFVLRFGFETATDDREGLPTITSPVRPDDAAIDAVLGRFVGEIVQVPPAFSAIKVAGERAYRMARRQEAPDLAPRRVHIAKLVRRARLDADRVAFELECGPGTYVRALARDLARCLDAAGHIDALRRTRAGRFAVADAISLEMLQTLRHIPPDCEHLISIATALDDIPALALTEAEARDLGYGRSLTTGAARRTGDVAVALAMQGERPIALVRVADGRVTILRVLNL